MTSLGQCRGNTKSNVSTVSNWLQFLTLSQSKTAALPQLSARILSFKVFRCENSSTSLPALDSFGLLPPQPCPGCFGQTAVLAASARQLSWLLRPDSIAMVLMMDCGGVLSAQGGEKKDGDQIWQAATHGAYAFVQCYKQKFGPHSVHVCSRVNRITQQPLGAQILPQHGL